MKTKRVVAILSITGASLCHGQSARPQKEIVIVCMKPDQSVLMGVRPLASAMFARIDVRIEWREPNSCPVGVNAMHVRLSHDSLSIRNSEALGFSLPYQGTIVVFLDRVQALHRDGVPSLIAHVLVHEITHVLEGIDRHSATGIMKARWDDHDFYEMRRKSLLFDREDVNLIQLGLREPRVAPAVAVARAGIAGKGRTAYR